MDLANVSPRELAGNLANIANQFEWAPGSSQERMAPWLSLHLEDAGQIVCEFFDRGILAINQQSGAQKFIDTARTRLKEGSKGEFYCTEIVRVLHRRRDLWAPRLNYTIRGKSLVITEPSRVQALKETGEDQRSYAATMRLLACVVEPKKCFDAPQYRIPTGSWAMRLHQMTEDLKVFLITDEVVSSLLGWELVESVIGREKCLEWMCTTGVQKPVDALKYRIDELLWNAHCASALPMRDAINMYVFVKAKRLLESHETRKHPSQFWFGLFPSLGSLWLPTVTGIAKPVVPLSPLAEYVDGLHALIDLLDARNVPAFEAAKGESLDTSPRSPSGMNNATKQINQLLGTIPKMQSRLLEHLLKTPVEGKPGHFSSTFLEIGEKVYEEKKGSETSSNTIKSLLYKLSGTVADHGIVVTPSEKSESGLVELSRPELFDFHPDQLLSRS